MRRSVILYRRYVADSLSPLVNPLAQDRPDAERIAALRRLEYVVDSRRHDAVCTAFFCVP